MVGTALLIATLIAADAPALQAVGAAHWPGGAVIRVWIAPTAPTDSAALVERAMKTWSDAAAGRFTLEKTIEKSAAAVRVRFSTPGGVYGETLPLVDRRTRLIVAADVLIVSEIDGDALDKHIVIYLTALHELGHALGLAHTDDFDDIMYRFRRPDDGERYFGRYRERVRSAGDIGSAPATGLSPADIAALRRLYDR